MRPWCKMPFRSALLVRRAKKHAIGSIPALKSSNRRRSVGEGTSLSSASGDSTLTQQQQQQQQQWLNIRTLEFAVMDMLPPDITGTHEGFVS